MENPFENKPAEILTKEKILSRIPERAHLVRELSDEQGLYLLEVEVKGEKPGETIQFEYMRKGRYPNKNEASESAIHAVYYQDGQPISGAKIAVYNYETGEWEKV